MLSGHLSLLGRLTSWSIVLFAACLLSLLQLCEEGEQCCRDASHCTVRGFLM